MAGILVDRKIQMLGIVLLLVLSTGCTNKPSSDNLQVESSDDDAVSKIDRPNITLEKWDVSDRKYSYEELESKYYELYNYSFSHLIKEYIKAEVIPSGVPAVYGEELGVSYDGEPDKMISILRRYEGIPLEGELLDRYIHVGSSISCEYCCGVKVIVYPDGKAACGCAHSYAMRGLIKYLLLNHPAEYTDDQIIEELAKWKTTYFPRQSIQKVFDNYAETNEIDPSILEEMPSMVGSC